MPETISTDRLQLVPADLSLLGAAIAGRQSLAEYLNVRVPPNWTDFGLDALSHVQTQLRERPAELGWWTYFPVHQATSTLIGSGGYKGPPTNGRVELTYEIASDWRRQGYATEMVRALMRHAFTVGVQVVTANTVATENASASVLRKLGFVRISESDDPRVGILWKWERRRPVYSE